VGQCSNHHRFAAVSARRKENRSKEGKLASTIALPTQIWADLSPTRRAVVIRLTIAAAMGAILGLSAIGFMLNLPLILVLGVYAFIIGVPSALAVGNIRRWLLIICLFDIALQQDIYFGFDLPLSLLGSISGFSIGLTTAAVGVLYGMWFAELLFLKRTPYRRPRLSVAGPLLIYLAAAVISVVAANKRLVSFYELFMLGQTFLLMIYMAGAIRRRSDLMWLIGASILFIGLEALVAFGQRFAGLFLFPGMDPSRPSGWFGSPNVAGTYFAVMLTLTMSIWIMPIKTYWKLATLPIFMMGLAALILTQSRGGWVAFGIGAGLLVLMSWYRGWLPTIVPVSMIVGGLVVGSILFPVLADRLTQDDGGAAEARGPLNSIALEMFQDRPLTGIGVNNFATVLPNYIPPQFSSEWLYTVHNYLLVLSETGIFGLIGFVGFLLYTVRRGFLVWFARNRFYSPIGLALTTGLLGHIFHLTVDIFNFRPPVQMLWVNAAFITAMLVLVREEKAEAEAQTAS
jgi:O-antigen ligase